MRNKYSSGKTSHLHRSFSDILSFFRIFFFLFFLSSIFNYSWNKNTPEKFSTTVKLCELNEGIFFKSIWIIHLYIKFQATYVYFCLKTNIYSFLLYFQLSLSPSWHFNNEITNSSLSLSLSLKRMIAFELNAFNMDT